MANRAGTNQSTIQKQIKFSKGQVSSKLSERTDMSILDASALEMTNYIATIQGGFRSRSGTYITSIDLGLEENVSATVLSGIGNTEHLFDATTYKSGAIGNNKIVWVAQLSSNTNGVNISLLNACLDDTPLVCSSTGGDTGSLSLYGEYRVEVYGGGAFTGADYIAYSGGGGAGFDGIIACSTTQEVSYTVGGGSNYSASVYNGSASTITATDNGDVVGSISAGGGNLGAYNFKGGKLEISRLPVFHIYETRVSSDGNDGRMQTQGEQYIEGALSLYDGTYDGYGASKCWQSGVSSPYQNGVTGFVRISSYRPYFSFFVEYSNDNTNWHQTTGFSVSTNPTTRKIQIPAGYTYVRLSCTAHENCPDSLKMDRVLITKTGSVNTNVRLLKFAFNTDEEYILVLSDERIIVMNDGVKTADIPASGLIAQYIPYVKTTQKEDTMIFCHPDMPPKELIRSLDQNNNVVWTWRNFSLYNIPYYAFDGETSTAKTVSITPSATEGAITITAASSVFSSDSVGQFIDGGGGRARITGFISGTKISAVTQIPFYTTDAITSWEYLTGYEPVWSETRGYPRSCLFAQQRLWFGGSKERPSSLWASRVGQYNNFKNAGNYNNDAINVDLLTMNPIINLMYNRSLQIFTTGEEWIAPETSLTPSDFNVSINTRNGCYEKIDPVMINGSVCFIEKNGKSLLELQYDYSVASYKTGNLSLLSDLLIEPAQMDVDINSSRDKGDYLYIVLSDGRMIVNTTCLDENINAPSFFKTDGKILSVCCLNKDTYILVLRSDLVCLEKITDACQTDAQASINILPDSNAGTAATVGGLHQYGGKKVLLWNDAGYRKEISVLTDGSFTIDKAPGNVYIGLPFKSTLRSNYIEVGGQRANIKKRISRACVETEDTDVLSLNGVEKKGKLTYNWYGVCGYSRDTTFTITSSFYPVYVKGITLYINFGGMI